VLAEDLGLDTAAWPPSTKAGAQYIAIDHVKQRIPGLYLQDTAAEDLDRLQLRLKKETGLSNKTINMVMAAVNTPIREAYRKGKLFKDPSENFRTLSENSKKRGILSSSESKGIFSLIWNSQHGRLSALVAYSTGARLGEILSLTPDDIVLDFEGKPAIWFRKSFSRYSGVKSTKTGSEKVVPISTQLRDDLIALFKKNPHNNSFIFWGESSKVPITQRIIQRSFSSQLHKIGIDEETRLARNLSFHSLRHNVNATLRGKIDEATLRFIMGHASPESSDTYDHLTDKKFANIRKIIEKNLLNVIGM